MQEETSPHVVLCDAAYHGDLDTIRQVLADRENRYYVNEFLNYDEHMGEVCSRFKKLNFNNLFR